MRKLLVAVALLLVLCGSVSWWHHRPLHQPPGVLAPNEPEQDNIEDGAKLQQGDVTLTTRARFILTARVLSRADYSWGADGKLIPEDLALGWGRMSDSDVLANIDISQSDRFYEWSVKQFPIPRREIETHSANMHMIPPTPACCMTSGKCAPAKLCISKASWSTPAAPTAGAGTPR